MGFFNKIKNAMGQLTGKNATVQMQVSSPQVKRGDSINVSVTVTATGQLESKGLNVELVGTETIKYQVPSVTRESDGSLNTTYSETTKDNQTYQHQEALVAGGLSMNEGETRQFTGTLQVPATVPPTYTGIDAKNVYKIRAFVDVSMGADPDSTVEITIL